MPISPIVLQRRHAELGRIRLGAKRNGSGAPMKLEQFRFTSPSQGYITDLAALYGGDARPWDNNGKREFEVYTTATSLPVIAVKGGLSQWMETWSGGGCVHRCDGERGVDGELCNPDDPKHQAAKPTTRLSVMLPELEAIGVWRMESHGWNAAAEIPAVAELAQFVGDLVPANLHLIERRSVKDGKTSRFVVPVLDLQIGTARLKEIVAQRSGAGVELEGAQPPGQQAAIESGPAATDGEAEVFAEFLAMVEAATTLDELTGIWDELKNGHELVGPDSRPTEQREAFVAAFKARAHAIKGQSEQPAASGGDGQGDVVDAELVPDGADQDADRIWGDILRTAGSFDPPWTEDQVKDDFKAKVSVSAAAASPAELAAYLDELKGAVAA